MKMQLRHSIISATILAVTCLLLGTSASAVTHANKRIAYLFNDSRACTFFQLQGVAVADPAAGQSVWFALSKNHRNYNQNYAVLLGSKLGGQPVHVNTTGRVVCGHTEVNYVASP